MFIILLIFQIVVLIIPDFINSNTYNDKVFGRFNHLIIAARGTLLLIGLYKAQQGLFSILKNGFFNHKSEQKLNQSGVFFILSGISSIIYNILIMSELKLDIFINNFVQHIIILLIGFGLFIFSDFIKKGGVLKHENDLTI